MELDSSTSILDIFTPYFTSVYPYAIHSPSSKRTGPAHRKGWLRREESREQRAVGGGENAKTTRNDGRGFFNVGGGR
jgi:hypothetical protein